MPPLSPSPSLSLPPTHEATATLCEKCWKEEAHVHFAIVEQGVVREHNYCLACAHGESLSWLLAWGYSRDADDDFCLTKPELVIPSREGKSESEDGRSTAPLSPSPSLSLSPVLVATGVGQCECGCRIVVGAELPCGHTRYTLRDRARMVEHRCHCGRELIVPVPRVACRECSLLALDGGRPSDAPAVVASAETCLFDQHRREEGERERESEREKRGRRVLPPSLSVPLSR